MMYVRCIYMQKPSITLHPNVILGFNYPIGWGSFNTRQPLFKIVHPYLHGCNPCRVVDAAFPVALVPVQREKDGGKKRARQYELTKKELRKLGVVHQEGGERKKERRGNMGRRRPQQENENRGGKRRVDERTDRRRRTKTTIEHGNVNGTKGLGSEPLKSTNEDVD